MSLNKIKESLLEEELINPKLTELYEKKAEIGKKIDKLNLQIDIFEDEFILKLRKDANKTGGYYYINEVKIKLTETSLSKHPYYMNKDWQKMQFELIDLKYDMALVKAIINSLNLK